MVNKNSMMDTRKYVHGFIGCDICRKRYSGLQMHEIVSRRRMLGASEEDTRLSYAPEICSLLCQSCHEHVAPTKAGQRKLLEFNIALYGWQAVHDALYAIPERFRRDVVLPYER
jgi:hypothetical protein